MTSLDTITCIRYGDVALDALCVLDVISNFSFGFVTVNAASSKREVVSDCRRIAVRYLKHSCALEVISIGIPFQAAASRPLWVQWLSLLKLLRVQRLVRVRARERHRAHEAGRMPQNVVVAKMSDISKLLLAFITWAHLCGCICAHLLLSPPLDPPPPSPRKVQVQEGP
jgi:hypothetical protein